jgi:hypothetical protein
MTSILEKFERLAVIVLALALGACAPADEPVADEPGASAQSAEPMADTEEAVAGTEESAPEPDRFANMFISEVTHDFNPGLPIGARFPAIRALFEGEEIMTIDRFIRDRGAIFIAARSVDW